MQETKLQHHAGQIDLDLPGYHQFWNSAEKKGYSGVAIFTKVEPLSVTYGLGLEEHDHEGRVITAEFEGFYLVCCYTPNSQDGLKRLDYRMTWEDAFRAHLQALDEKKPVVLCGDLNVAHKEIDLKNPKTNRRNPGFTDEERGKMTALLGAGFTDTFRAKYPDLEGAYSWWSYRVRPPGPPHPGGRHPQRDLRQRPLPGGAAAGCIRHIISFSAYPNWGDRTYFLWL